jgi:ribulose kinase
VSTSFLDGDTVKSIRACLLFTLLGQAVFFPVAALSDTNFVQHQPHIDAAKRSMQRQMKLEKKQQKKARKFQRKAENKWKKLHQVQR